MKGSGTASLTEIDRFDGGVGWIAYPDETMQRASHALATEEGIWLIDPVDAPGLDDLIADVAADAGTDAVAGVVVCLDRHKRDAAAIARRHDTEVYIPRWMSGVASKLDAPVTRFAGELGDSGFESFVIRESSLPPWQEVGLYNPDTGTLVVPESVGTASYFLADDEVLGVHPMLRLMPPKTLERYDPERILVGHGAGVLSDAAAALDAALASSKSNAIELYGKTAKQFIMG
ncbi:hypothetical protein EGH24_04330 [Halonotius terrestris]|uniref:Uncharacterized protein n=2 Tax=Halonotius terrestris TaxID=2487750 RepID=A0A8J8PDA7_9EURY|nr:hypothetical protein EGH24_04330 [Halonotius terrestris]